MSKKTIQSHLSHPDGRLDVTRLSINKGETHIAQDVLLTMIRDMCERLHSDQTLLILGSINNFHLPHIELHHHWMKESADKTISMGIMHSPFLDGVTKQTIETYRERLINTNQRLKTKEEYYALLDWCEERNISASFNGATLRDFGTWDTYLDARDPLTREFMEQKDALKGLNLESPLPEIITSGPLAQQVQIDVVVHRTMKDLKKTKPEIYIQNTPQKAIPLMTGAFIEAGIPTLRVLVQKKQSEEWRHAQFPALKNPKDNVRTLIIGLP